MVSPAYIVEGDMEQRFLQSVCNSSVPIRLLGVNGQTVSVEAIAKRVETHINLLSNRHYPIVIVFDREGRDESSEEIRRQLLENLAGMKVSTDQLCIGVADRMTETWIVADRTSLSENFGIELGEGNREGQSNVGLLKKATGNSYHKTTTGVDMLKKASAAAIAENSESFKVLYEQLDNVECYWKDT